MLAEYLQHSWATAAHPYNLEINGVDHIARVDYSTLRLAMAGPGSLGQLDFTLSDPDGSLAVEKWDEVTFTEWAASRPHHFGGFVQHRSFRPWAAGGGRDIVISATGYGLLLGRKVVPGWSPYWQDVVDDVDGYAISLVNRHGGRVTARSATTNDTDAAHGVCSYLTNWSIQYDTPLPTATLDDMLDQMAAAGRYYDNSGRWKDCSAAFWVDGLAQLRMFPDPQPPDSADGHYRYSFDGGTAAELEVDLTGANVVEAITYEDSDEDRVSAVYTQNGQVQKVADEGAGWYLLDWTNMSDTWIESANGTYLLDNDRPTWGRGFTIKVGHSSTSTTDEVGTLIVTGIDLFGGEQQESITPKVDGVVFGNQVWDHIVSVESRDWEATAGSDTIRIGNGRYRWEKRSVNTWWYSAPVSERVGDLETFIADDGLNLTTARRAAGSTIAQTIGTEAAGRVVLSAEAPIDVWTGQHIVVTDPASEQDGTVGWRITEVVISWSSSTHRQYEITYGGTMPRPSLSRLVRAVALGRRRLRKGEVRVKAHRRR